MESTFLGGRGNRAAWMRVLGRSLATLAVLSLAWVASPANAQFDPFPPGGPGGEPNPMDISWTLSPSGTLDEDSNIVIEVTPSTSTTYSGDVRLDLSRTDLEPVLDDDGNPVYVPPEVYNEQANNGPVTFTIGTLAAGDYHAEILFTEDGAMFPNSRGFDFTVEGEEPPPLVPVLSPTGDRSGEVDEPVDVTFSVTNDTDTYTFTADNLPDGLSIDAGTGQVTGTPDTAGEFEVTITATSGSKIGALSFTWTISEPPPPFVPVLSPAGARSTVKGTSVDVTFSVTNDSGATYAFSATNLPAGLSIDAGTGKVTGTPTATGAPNVTITATSGGKVGTLVFTWTITEPSTPPIVQSATTSKLTISAVVAGKKPKFSATVIAKNGSKPDGKLKIVVYNSKGKSIKTVTVNVKKGKATYSGYKISKAGSYSAKATFTPSKPSLFKSSATAKKTFKVKKPAKKSAARIAPVGIAAPMPNPAADAVIETQLGALGDAASLLLEIGSSNITSPTVENSFAFASDQVEISTSLAAIQEAAGNEKRGAVDIWVKGSFGFLNTSGARGTSGAVTLGADYMFAPEFIGGIGLSLDRQMSDEIAGPGTATGYGWLIAPYLKGRIADVIGYGVTIGGGGVDNELSPDGTYTDIVTGTRWLAAATVSGDIPLPGEWKLSPSLTASYVEQRMNAYASGGGGTVAATASGLAKLAIAPSLERTFLLSDDGTTVTIGGNLELALEAANQNGVFATPYWRVGGGLDLSLALAGGATLRSGVDISHTQSGSTSLRGIVGLSAAIK